MDQCSDIKETQEDLSSLLLCENTGNRQLSRKQIFPGGSDSNGSACKAGDPDSIPGLEEFHGQRSRAGCSPWGPKESDRTERLSPSLLHGRYQ